MREIYSLFFWGPEICLALPKTSLVRTFGGLRIFFHEALFFDVFLWCILQLQDSIRFTASKTPIRRNFRSSGRSSCPPVSALQLRLGQHQKVEEPLCFSAILGGSTFTTHTAPSHLGQRLRWSCRFVANQSIGAPGKVLIWAFQMLQNVANPENWKTFGRNIGKFWNIWTYSIWKAGICSKAGCSNFM